MTTSQVGACLGATRHQVGTYIASGRLPVAAKVPGRRGALLFAADAVEKLALELADEADKRAKQLRTAVG